MSVFFRQFKQLLPNARAWRLSKGKQLTQFFQGLTGLGQDYRPFIDSIFDDCFPSSTRQLDEWDDQFGHDPDPSMSEAERRERIAGAWMAKGGQSPRYLEDVFQEAGFPVFLHPWWEEPRTVPPVAKNPLEFLESGNVDQFAASDGSINAQDGDEIMQDGAGTLQLVLFSSQDGGIDAQDGDELMQDGGLQAARLGYVLVNKLMIRDVATSISEGSLQAQDGNVDFQDGTLRGDYVPLLYALPTDQTKWPYFLYIGGEAFPDTAEITASRRDEFEKLVLKLCPAQQWLGILVEYV